MPSRFALFRATCKLANCGLLAYNVLAVGRSDCKHLFAGMVCLLVVHDDDLPCCLSRVQICSRCFGASYCPYDESNLEASETGVENVATLRITPIV